MSDFGSEVNNSALQLGGNFLMKLLEALIGLIRKLYEAWLKAPERKIQKMRLAEMKTDSEKRDFLEKIEGKVGFVRHEELVKANVPLTMTDVSMSKEDFKKFSARCKREGILISAVIDSRDLSLNNKKMYLVVCKEADLARVARVIDLMNDEKLLEAGENRLYELLDKGAENLTLQDKADIAYLMEQRENIQRGNCHKLNDAQAKGITEKAVTGTTKDSISFDASLNRNTGGRLDKDAHCIVADATDPANYIKCHGYMDSYKDKAYIKTDYEVYKNGEHVYATHDGRFDGRQAGYWDVEKAAMQSKGGIGDTVLKFYSQNEYEKYVQFYSTQNEKELIPLKYGEEGRDFGTIRASLEDKLNECGCSINKDGFVVDEKTGYILSITDDMSITERARIAEAQVIAKQINNYVDLEKLETDAILANASVLIKEEGTKEHGLAVKQYEEISNKYQASLETEANLIEDRKSINAVQAEQDVRTAPVIEFSLEDKQKISLINAEIAWKQEMVQMGLSYWSKSNTPQQQAVHENINQTINAYENDLVSLRAQLEDTVKQAEVNAVAGIEDKSKDMDRDNQPSMKEYKEKIQESKRRNASKDSVVDNEKTHKEAKSKTSIEKDR